MECKLKDLEIDTIFYLFLNGRKQYYKKGSGQWILKSAKDNSQKVISNPDYQKDNENIHKCYPKLGEQFQKNLFMWIADHTVVYVE